MTLFLTVAVLGIVTAWRFVWPAEQLAAAEEALRQHDFPEARSCLDRYLARWPGDPKGLLLAARASWQTGDHADAEHYITASEDQTGPTDAKLGTVTVGRRSMPRCANKASIARVSTTALDTSRYGNSKN